MPSPLDWFDRESLNRSVICCRRRKEVSQCLTPDASYSPASQVPSSSMLEATQPCVYFITQPPRHLRMEQESSTSPNRAPALAVIATMQPAMFVRRAAPSLVRRAVFRPAIQRSFAISARRCTSPDRIAGRLKYIGNGILTHSQSNPPKATPSQAIRANSSHPSPVRQELRRDSRSAMGLIRVCRNQRRARPHAPGRPARHNPHRPRTSHRPGTSRNPRQNAGRRHLRHVAPRRQPER